MIPAGQTIAAAVDALIAELRYPASDPRAVIGAVARLLAVELDRAPSPTLARELRCHLDHLADSPNSPAGVVDEIRARRAQRRVGQLIQRAGLEAGS